jgi:hypothetical protein
VFAKTTTEGKQIAIGETIQLGHTSRALLQFAQTPRFNHGRSTQAPPSTPRPSIVSTTVNSSVRAKREDVEEVASPEMHDDFRDRRGRYLDEEDDYYNAHAVHANGKDRTELFHQTNEQVSAATLNNEINEGGTWSQELPFSPKRRKLRQPQADQQQEHEHPMPIDNPARPIFQRPTVPASAARPEHLTTSIPQFVTVGAPSTSSNTSSRPTFLRPAENTDVTALPLPEIFSPHRRGAKFVPGGTAAIVQQWILQAGQDAIMSRRTRRFDDNFAMTITVRQVHGSGPMIISGCRVGDEESTVEILLSAHATAASSRGCEVVPGCRVGIRAPMWDVIGPGGRSLIVAADWRSLPA